MKYWLKAILTPSCWMQINDYSKSWDRRLNHLMIDNKFRMVSEYRARIGNISVWVANHPYGSFATCDGFIVRPSRATIMRAMEKLIDDTLDMGDAA